MTPVTRLPTAPMPESAAFLAPFRVRFARREGPVALERLVGYAHRRRWVEPYYEETTTRPG